MKSRIFGWAAVAWMVACFGCSKEPGEIAISIDTTAVDAVKDQIENYLFIVSDGTKKLLFPADCIGADGDNTCVKPSGCGFPKGEKNFRPKISFDDFRENVELTLIVCAVGSKTATVIGAGQGTIANTAGFSQTVALSTTVTSCTQNFTALCPP